MNLIMVNIQMIKKNLEFSSLKINFSGICLDAIGDTFKIVFDSLQHQLLKVFPAKKGSETPKKVVFLSFITFLLYLNFLKISPLLKLLS